MSEAERHHADQLICVFENDTLLPQYAYVERLDDGRGFTAGRVGFTTGTGDLLQVVQRYTRLVPKNPLAVFLPALRTLLAAPDKDEIAGLEGLTAAWTVAADDSRFRAVQDALVDQLYYRPAMAHAHRLGIRTALGKAILYDAIVQHGDGDDPDSLPAMLERTEKGAGGSPRHRVDERDFLRAFLVVRRATLSHAEDGATRAAWAESVGRVDVFRTLLDTGNVELQGPIQVEVGGRSIRIP